MRSIACVDQHGHVTAVLGTHNHGQGHETVFAQILSSRLGVALDAIEIVEGDTARIAHGTGTFGSRSVAVGGSALVGAADSLIAEGKCSAARILNVPAAEVRFDPAQGFIALGHRLSFTEVARASQGWRAKAEFDPASFAFSNGVHLCEVEVTRDTGEVCILRYIAVDDVGTVINPVIVEGQLHGGVAQGLGQALKETCIYDPESGQLLSGSFLDYGLLRAQDMPGTFIDETDQSQPFTLNPLGAKGAGEAGTIAAPAALVSAVLDALRPDGVDDLEMPLTPARVWAALQRRVRA